jgi:hypothetical protein
VQNSASFVIEFDVRASRRVCPMQVIGYEAVTK